MGSAVGNPVQGEGRPTVSSPQVSPVCPAGEAGAQLPARGQRGECEGELINLQGKILSVDGNKITIMPKHEDLR